LPFWYERVEDFDENRIFHFIEASYISENIPLRKDVIMVDDENDIVYFLTA